MPPAVLLVRIVDPRRPQARRHSLERLLLAATPAVICGADRGIEVELFGRRKQAWPATFPGCPAAFLPATPSGMSLRGGSRRRHPPRKEHGDPDPGAPALSTAGQEAPVCPAVHALPVIPMDIARHCS